MNRALLGWSLSVLSLVLGLLTAAISAENRARGAELDRLQRWCEAESRANELLAVDNARREWALLGGERIRAERQPAPDSEQANAQASEQAPPSSWPERADP